MNSNFIVLWIEIMHSFPIFLELMGLDDNKFQLHPCIFTYILYDLYAYILHGFIHSFLSLILSEAPARKSSIFRSGAACAKSFAYHLARFLGCLKLWGFGLPLKLMTEVFRHDHRHRQRSTSPRAVHCNAPDCSSKKSSCFSEWSLIIFNYQ